MTLPLWPAELPYFALENEGFDLTPHQPLNRMEMSEGAARVRNMYTNEHVPLEFSFYFTAAQLKEFLQFYHESLENGTLYFNMPVFIIDYYGEALVRFAPVAKPYEQKAVGSDYIVKASIEWANPDYSSEGAGWFLETYGEENLFLWESQLNQVVYVEYPKVNVRSYEIA